MKRFALMVTCASGLLLSCAQGSPASPPNIYAGLDAGLDARAAAGSDAGSDAAASCSDVSGSWVIKKHCGAALVGMTVMISQTGCTFTTTGIFAGFTGTIQSDGTLTMQGTANGMDVMCTGTATSAQISERCTGDCDVMLAR